MGRHPYTDRYIGSPIVSKLDCQVWHASGTCHMNHFASHMSIGRSNKYERVACGNYSRFGIVYTGSHSHSLTREREKRELHSGPVGHTP